MPTPTPPRRSRTGAAVAAVVLAAATLVGCGATDGAEEPTEARTASDGQRFNDADVAFATAMIPHHAQATEMVNLARGRGLDPQVQRIADGILVSQTAEIQTMVGWLSSWDEPVPATSQDHANAHGDGSDAELHSDMPGMMTPERMDQLEAASGPEFQRLWVEMMIEHHEGAIEMAEAQAEDGLYPDAVELAEQVVSEQQAEIEELEDLRDS